MMEESMAVEKISVIKVRNVLMATIPANPDDATISAMQEQILQAMDQVEVNGLVLDISPVDTLDSYFAQTVSETAKMVALMGGQTVIVGMRPSVAITATELGLTLNSARTALNVDRALDMFNKALQPERPR
jgi:rsbT antagonist protein RsbS